jgi:hypothetical protein
MINKAGQATHKVRLHSVTEVIADACGVVIAQPLLLLIPMLLDLYYLAGWKLTVGGTLDGLVSRAKNLSSEDGDRMARFLGDAARVDLTAIVSFVVPSLLGGSASDDFYHPFSRPTVDIDSWVGSLLVITGLIFLSAVVFGIFGLWLADAGLNRPRRWDKRLALALSVGGRFLLMLLLVIGMLCLIFLPMMFALFAAAIAGLDLQALVVPIMFIIGLVVFVLFYFAPEALLVADVGPSHALRLSSRVVRKHLWASVGFALATIVITVGLGDVWMRIATNASGLLIAVIANAFVGCSLSLASILFFNERLQTVSNDSPYVSSLSA